MRQLPILLVLLVCAVAFGKMAEAAQYEALLLPERSLRYQNSFGLFADDFEGFVQPRRSTRWDGDRLVTQLTNLTPQNTALLGYGHASTDAWSWTVLGSGGYRRESKSARDDSLHLLSTDQGLLQIRRGEQQPGGTSFNEGQARMAVGMGSDWAGGQVGFGLQGLWSNTAIADATQAPGLFTFPAPNPQARSSTELSQLIESSAPLQTTSSFVNPHTRLESLRGAVVAGYQKNPLQRGAWGWGLDVLGGVERIAFHEETQAFESTGSAEGSAQTRFLGQGSWSGLTPLIGAALTLTKLGNGLTYFDLGGEYAPGVNLSGTVGTAQGNRQVSLHTGGLNRVYSRNELRTDLQTGNMGGRLQITAGMRHISQLDSRLQLGWGLNATWRQASEDRTLVSGYEISELFDANGDGNFNNGDIRAQARGKTSYIEKSEWRELDIRLPLALMMAHASDTGLEWRIGSELRFQNTWKRQSAELTSVVVPSGRKFMGDGQSAPTRFGNALLPAGGIDEAREIELTATLRAGAGYWFTRSAKIDFILSAEPAGHGFVDFSDPSFGVSALLVF